MKIASIISLLLAIPLVIINAENFLIQLTPQSNEYSYTLRLYFGFQTYNVLFDTGSSDLWLHEIHCIDCRSKVRFDPHDPTHPFDTQYKPFEIQYASGKVSGYTGVADYFLSVVYVRNQIFGLAQSITSFKQRPYDGIIG